MAAIQDVVGTHYQPWPWHTVVDPRVGEVVWSKCHAAGVDPDQMHCQRTLETM